MPRRNVGPGSESKRPASIASTCRAASFNWCATSETVKPSSSRALFNSAPIASVILSPLQRLVFGRGREAPAQLVRVALLGDALTEPALDAQPEPERFGARRDELVMAREQLPRLLDAALAVADVG